MEKKSFKERAKDRFTRQNILRFLDKQGFYIILFLCLCIIGTTAILTSTGGIFPRSGVDQSDGPTDGIPLEASPQPNDIDIQIKDVIGNEDDEKAVEPNNQNPEEAAGQDEQPPDQAPAGDKGGRDYTGEKPEAVQTVSKTQAGSQVMTMPVTGEIIKGYAMEELVYSRTLKEWTTHSGIDIASPLGTEVRAALKGTVESVHEDTLMGIVITLDHGEGLKTVYAGLSTRDMVRIGQKVEKGQVISGVGRTAAIEIADAPHLHFEVLLNGEYQDPIGYLER